MADDPRTWWTVRVGNATRQTEHRIYGQDTRRVRKAARQFLKAWGYDPTDKSISIWITPEETK